MIVTCGHVPVTRCNVTVFHATSPSTCYMVKNVIFLYPQTLRLLQKVSSVSVLPDVERRDRDKDRVRSLGGQIADEGDISELDQRVRYLRMYAGVGEVGSEIWQCIGCCVPYMGEQLWATNLGTVGLLTSRRLLCCLSTNSQVCCAA